MKASGPVHKVAPPAEIPYAEKTFGDRNPLKRYLQSKRLRDALTLAKGLPQPAIVVDYGAGNGEFCKHLSRCFPHARIACFEPHPGLLQQARENLAGQPRIEFVSSVSALPHQGIDLLFSLEVFEHLPAVERDQALETIGNLLGPAGHAVIGIPVEVGLPALYKGLFRMLRRFGEFDARPLNVLRSALGNPPGDRPAVELLPGVHYHLHHLGFDHRAFRALLSRSFREVRHSGSPLRRAGTWVNAELNLLVTDKTRAE